jgi:Exodeoxyribonuclease X-like C-terminal
MPGEIVPFGKYKGQPVEAVLAADPGYCDWLTGQPWVRDRYVNVYNVLIAHGEQQDSPEHNQMQARFLDDAWCLALADHLGLREHHGLGPARAQVAEDPNVERFRRHVAGGHTLAAIGGRFGVSANTIWHWCHK